MAIPSGSGSEVLRNACVHNNNAATANIDFGGTTGTGTLRTSGNTAGVINVPANVIITVLNMTCTANSGNHNIYSIIDWQGSGTGATLFFHKDLLVDTTFVWNERIVLREGDELKVVNSASHCTWTVNFIYQDWT